MDQSINRQQFINFNSFLTYPDARHLVHEDQAALKAVVHLVVAGVGDAAPLHLLPPYLQKFFLKLLNFL